MEQYQWQDLEYLLQRLRDPESGCPWDLKQDLHSLTRYTIEEVYEVVDAIENNDYDALRNELGDLLFQVVFYCRLASERKLFDLNDVVQDLVSKYVRRHPHIFGEGSLYKSSQNTLQSSRQVADQWDVIKSSEPKKGEQECVKVGMPPIERSQKLQRYANQSGFKWQSTRQMTAKITEELQELQSAMAQQDSENIVEELGDLIFSCINVATELKIDAEHCLRKANNKFHSRLQYVLQHQKSADIAHLEQLWQQAKDCKK